MRNSTGITYTATNNKTLLPALVITLFCGANNAYADLIEVDTNSIFYIDSQARDKSLVDYVDAAAVSIQQSGNLTAATGNSSSNTTFELYGDANGHSLLFGFDHTMTGDGNESSWARSSAQMRFTVNQDTNYDFTGFYDMAGPATTTDFTIRFTDVSGGAGDLFRYRSLSYFTANETFNLDGSTDADAAQMYIGNTSGLLTAGTTYQFSLEAMIHSTQPGGVIGIGDFDATGEVNLVIGNGGSKSVPAPSALFLILSGLLGLIISARKVR